jgi:hypothetical protein
MTTVPATVAYVRLYRALRVVREIPRGSNRGYPVETILASTHTPPGKAWCASMASYAGREMFGAEWPLPLTASCDVLLEAADKAGVLLFTRHAWVHFGRKPEDEHRITAPTVGDLFFVMRTRHDAVHVGAIENALEDDAFLAVEGNASDPKAPPTREGWGVFAGRKRGHADDPTLKAGYTYCLARWATLLK